MTAIRTRSDIVSLLAETHFPDGWRVEVVEVRRYRYRSNWAIHLMRGEDVVSSVSTYEPREVIRRFALSAAAAS